MESGLQLKESGIHFQWQRIQYLASRIQDSLVPRFSLLPVAPRGRAGENPGIEVESKTVLNSITWVGRVGANIVSGVDWLWKPANIKVENNGATVYVGSSLTVLNPFLFVHKLWLNRSVRCFYWPLSSKWYRNAIDGCARSSPKKLTKPHNNRV